MASSPRERGTWDAVGEPKQAGGIRVTLTRTAGQEFREQIGFVILCIIGTYCMMRILIELKSVLQPFLWALFLVMALKPVVDSLEKQIEKGVSMATAASLGRQVGESTKKNEDMPGDEDERAEELESFLDSDPEGAVIGKTVSPRQEKGFVPHEVDSGLGDGLVVEGKKGWRKSFSRILAVLIVFGMTMAVLSGFGFVILESARHMRNHWDVYQKGAQNLTTQTLGVLGYMFQKMPENMKRRYEDVTADVMKTAQDLIYSLLGDFVNNVSSLLLFVLMTMLYTLFWLCSPVPLNASVDAMFRRYIMFKTLACVGFGICVGVLLALLSIDLASVFALTTCALSFVPEIGPFLAMVLPCPVILFDSRLDRPVLVLIVALLGQLGLKFVFSYFIEAKLIESDKKLRMHPVMILVSVGIFGYLWGPTGMLLSVPLMALLKISLFSDLVPASYRDPILVILEGDRSAPLRHSLPKQPLLRAPPGG